MVPSKLEPLGVRLKEELHGLATGQGGMGKKYFDWIKNSEEANLIRFAKEEASKGTGPKLKMRGSIR